MCQAARVPRDTCWICGDLFLKIKKNEEEEEKDVDDDGEGGGGGGEEATGTILFYIFY